MTASPAASSRREQWADWSSTHDIAVRIRRAMKLLLTSAGIKNRSIQQAMLDLLGRPIADCNALCIPTAGYGHPHSGPGNAWKFVAGQEPDTPMCELGWKSVGLLELTALPSVARERWTRWVQQADVLLVN